MSLYDDVIWRRYYYVRVLKGATTWMDKWKKNGWKQSKGEDVANRDELEQLDVAAKDIKVTYVSNIITS